MAEFDSRLLAKGRTKVNLLIQPANKGVQAFYERLGYNRDELIFMEKRLT
jgi:ribosomal protein S18 acetylase RimI-like enzyme